MSLPFDPDPAEFGLTHPALVAAMPDREGWLVALDAGEWGGGVWWYSRNGDSSYLVARGNPIGLETLEGQPVVVSGLTHLAVSTGYVGVLERDDNGKWSLGRKLELPAAADAYFLDGDSLIIATSLGLVELVSGEITRLTSSHLAGMYMTSMVGSKEGPIVVGMRDVVVEYAKDNLGVWTEQWLLPPSCPSLTADDGEGDSCSCREGEYSSRAFEAPVVVSDDAKGSGEVAWFFAGLLALLMVALWIRWRGWGP